MFQPSQHDVRRTICQAWQRRRAGLPLEAVQAQLAPWLDAHPEYDADFADEAAALARDYPVEAGRTNPFLHLSMHLAIDEQIAIDQPRGIRQAAQRLAERTGSLHAAHHQMMECLGTMIWESQRSGRPPDGHAYLQAVQRLATAD